MNRREFACTSGAAAISLIRPSLANPTRLPWDPGDVRHLLPTASSDRIRLKASFRGSLREAPTLRAGNITVQGHAADSIGEFWSFDVGGLRSGATHRLELRGKGGRSLCEPWVLQTFPQPQTRVDSFRALFFTCAGGHDALGYLPATVRNRLLRRALDFSPQAVVANGDHVYWDLRTRRADLPTGASSVAIEIAGRFDRADAIFGTANEAVLKRAVTPQIVPVYGTDFRSTPVFFLQDDHDHFDNDEASPNIVSYPPSWFMLQLARATQALYYPEFLPDSSRPLGLPWSAGDGRHGWSESFGTVRFGNLAEILLYDSRRTMSLAGKLAVLIEDEVEKWLISRCSASDVDHLLLAPSLPPGWSAGKWGDWYPDLLGKDGRLSTAVPKAHWQQGWLEQHDRLMSALTSMKSRAPLIVSGDLHAIAAGRVVRSGNTDLSGNPVTTILSGPIGTDPGGWPSTARGVGPRIPTHLDMTEIVSPVEEHGFTLVDFHPDRMLVQLFRWNRNLQRENEIDVLQPFQTIELPRPG